MTVFFANEVVQCITALLHESSLEEVDKALNCEENALITKFVNNAYRLNVESERSEIADIVEKDVKEGREECDPTANVTCSKSRKMNNDNNSNVVVNEGKESEENNWRLRRRIQEQEESYIILCEFILELNQEEEEYSNTELCSVADISNSKKKKCTELVVTNNLDETLRSKVEDKKHTVLSACVFITHNNTTLYTVSSDKVHLPLTAHYLFVESINVKYPLHTLSTLLERVYIPVVSHVQINNFHNNLNEFNSTNERLFEDMITDKQKVKEVRDEIVNSSYSSTLPVQIGMCDLANTIATSQLSLPAINLYNYIHPTILEICRRAIAHKHNTALSQQQVIKEEDNNTTNSNDEEVKETEAHLRDEWKKMSNDYSLVREVEELRNKCTRVLSIEHILSGAQYKQMMENNNTNACSLTHINVVKQQMKYWANTLRWAESVFVQLQYREWRELHNFLGSRVTTTFVREYAKYITTLREYISYLTRISNVQKLHRSYWKEELETYCRYQEEYKMLEDQNATLTVTQYSTLSSAEPLLQTKETIKSTDDVFTDIDVNDSEDNNTVRKMEDTANASHLSKLNTMFNEYICVLFDNLQTSSSYPHEMQRMIVDSVTEEILLDWVESWLIVFNNEFNDNVILLSSLQKYLSILSSQIRLLHNVQHEYNTYVSQIAKDMGATAAFADSTAKHAEAEITTSLIHSGNKNKNNNHNEVWKCFSYTGAKITWLAERTAVLYKTIETHIQLMRILLQVQRTLTYKNETSNSMNIQEQVAKNVRNEEFAETIVMSDKSANEEQEQPTHSKKEEDIEFSHNFDISIIASVRKRMQLALINTLIKLQSTFTELSKKRHFPYKANDKHEQLCNEEEYENKKNECDKLLAAKCEELFSRYASENKIDVTVDNDDAHDVDVSNAKLDTMITILKVYIWFRYIPMPMTQKTMNVYTSYIYQIIREIIQYIKNDMESTFITTITDSITEKNAKTHDPLVEVLHVSRGTKQIVQMHTWLHWLFDCANALDATNPQGWHALLHLRNAQLRWRMSSELANFLCADEHDLINISYSSLPSTSANYNQVVELVTEKNEEKAPLHDHMDDDMDSTRSKDDYCCFDNELEEIDEAKRELLGCAYAVAFVKMQFANKVGNLECNQSAWTHYVYDEKALSAAIRYVNTHTISLHNINDNNNDDNSSSVNQYTQYTTNNDDDDVRNNNVTWQNSELFNVVMERLGSILKQSTFFMPLLLEQETADKVKFKYSYNDVMEEIQEMRKALQFRVYDHVSKWLGDAEEMIMHWHVDLSTFKLRDPVFGVSTSSTLQESLHDYDINSNNNNKSASTTRECCKYNEAMPDMVKQLIVCFPWHLFTLSADLRVFDNMNLFRLSPCQRSSSLSFSSSFSSHFRAASTFSFNSANESLEEFATDNTQPTPEIVKRQIEWRDLVLLVRAFVRSNEWTGQVAMTLTKLLQLYYKTIIVVGTSNCNRNESITKTKGDNSVASSSHSNDMERRSQQLSLPSNSQTKINEFVESATESESAEIDTLITSLAPHEYSTVNELLQTHLFVHWDDITTIKRFAIQFASSLEHFTNVISHIREQSNKICYKINELREHVFLPIALTQHIVNIIREINHLASQSNNSSDWLKQQHMTLYKALMIQIQFHLRAWTLDFTSMNGEAKYYMTSVSSTVYKLKPLRLRLEFTSSSTSSKQEVEIINNNSYISHGESADARNLDSSNCVTLSGSPAEWRHYWLNELNRVFEWLYSVVPLAGKYENICKNDKQVNVMNDIVTDQISSKNTECNFTNLMSEVSAEIVREPLYAIEGAISALLELEEEWQRNALFLNVNFAMLANKLENDLHKWNDVMNMLDRITVRLSNHFTQPFVVLSGFVVMIDIVHSELITKLHVLHEFMLHKYHDVIKRTRGNLANHLQCQLDELNALDVAHDLQDAATFLCAESEIKDKLTGTYTEELENIDTAHNLLQNMHYTTTRNKSVEEEKEGDKLEEQEGNEIIEKEDDDDWRDEEEEQQRSVIHDNFSKVESAWTRMHDELALQWPELVNSLSEAIKGINSNVHRLHEELEQYVEISSNTFISQSTNDVLGSIAFLSSQFTPTHMSTTKHITNNVMSSESRALSLSKPELSLSLIEIAEQASRVAEDVERVRALQVKLSQPSTENITSVEELMHDIERVQGVWGFITEIGNELYKLSRQTFVETEPRTLYDTLQTLLRRVEQWCNAPEEQMNNVNMITSVITAATTSMSMIESGGGGHSSLVQSVMALCSKVEVILRRLVNNNRLISDLHSESFVPVARAHRYWALLKERLHAKWNTSTLTLGDLWSANLAEHAHIVNEVIELANGERRIAQQLKRIEEFWSTEYYLDLVLYKNSNVCLIRGWNELFEHLEDDLSTCAGMRASPFFAHSPYVTLVNELETRLSFLYQLLQELLEVQKQWVYLDGIFATTLLSMYTLNNGLENKDVGAKTVNSEEATVLSPSISEEHQQSEKTHREVRLRMPHEAELFDSVSKELLEILPHVENEINRIMISSSDNIDSDSNNDESENEEEEFEKETNVEEEEENNKLPGLITLSESKEIHLPHINVSYFVQSGNLLYQRLKRMRDQLDAVQSGLTQYLQSQRSQFARFFFINDDDLLELLSVNSTSPTQTPSAAAMHTYKISTINRHLRKMFTALSSIIVHEDNKKAVEDETDENNNNNNNNTMKKLQLSNAIIGFASAAGEKVYFDLQRVKTSCNSFFTNEDTNINNNKRTDKIELYEDKHTFILYNNVELHVWLKELEMEMMRTLRMQTTLAMRLLCTYKHFTETILDTIDSCSFATQVICLALQLWWVQMQEADLVQLGSAKDIHDSCTTSSNVTLMDCTSTYESHSALREMNAILTLLANVLANKLQDETEADHSSHVHKRCNAHCDNYSSEHFRHSCEQIITLAVYQRDISRHITHERIYSVNDFEWIRVLRPYLSEDNDNNESARSATDDHNKTKSSDTYVKEEEHHNYVTCRMADASQVHGFEYTGEYNRLVQTVLSDRAYLTLMRALHLGCGGCLLGPAGTGKTETVKALGYQLGRHVLVFNCDERFDYVAVTRILRGLCQVGAWGCFDEFNRLEERILSALSQEIQKIQETLKCIIGDYSSQSLTNNAHYEIASNNKNNTADATTSSKNANLNKELRSSLSLMRTSQGKQSSPTSLHPHVAIFVTLNPNYASRSQLPGNLKQLFHTVTMAIPDQQTIAEVMLFAHGFASAEQLAKKVVPLFNLCNEQFSSQLHYDFGLRALKAVLIAAGRKKRQIVSTKETSNNVITTTEDSSSTVESTTSVDQAEERIFLESVEMNVMPRLVNQDAQLFYSLVQDFFPESSKVLHETRTNMSISDNHYSSDLDNDNYNNNNIELFSIEDKIRLVCESSGLSDNTQWINKISQLYYTQQERHGVMLLGPSGTGKTCAWKLLLAALLIPSYIHENGNKYSECDDNPKCNDVEIHAIVIDPKVLSKNELFGYLDVTTRDWTDGVFTSVLRTIIESEHNASSSEMINADNSDNNNKEQIASVIETGNNNERSSKNAEQKSSAKVKTKRMYWIIFDGDIDPEWVENLNSVLDDNKLLTLPNGERLALPQSVRILFEVHSLQFATPATISRCGIVCFDADNSISINDKLHFAFHCLSQHSLITEQGSQRVLSTNEDDYIFDLQKLFSKWSEHDRNTRNQSVKVKYVRGRQYHEYMLSANSNTLETETSAKQDSSDNSEISQNINTKHSIHNDNIIAGNANATVKDKNDALERSVLTNNINNDSFTSELNMSFSSTHNALNMSNLSFNNIDRQWTSTQGAHKILSRFQREAEQIKMVCLSIWQPQFVYLESTRTLPTAKILNDVKFTEINSDENNVGMNTVIDDITVSKNSKENENNYENVNSIISLVLSLLQTPNNKWQERCIMTYSADQAIINCTALLWSGMQEMLKVQMTKRLAQQWTKHHRHLPLSSSSLESSSLPPTQTPLRSAVRGNNNNSNNRHSESLYVTIAHKLLLFTAYWSVASNFSHPHRVEFAHALLQRMRFASIDLNPEDIQLLEKGEMVNVRINYSNGEWESLHNTITRREEVKGSVAASLTSTKTSTASAQNHTISNSGNTISSKNNVGNELIIPTVDTRRHEMLLAAWLGAGCSVILCGPPGSGKTMSINAVLSTSTCKAKYTVVYLNFSSGTTIKHVQKAIEQYCTIVSTPRGLVMRLSDEHEQNIVVAGGGGGNNNTTKRSSKSLLLFCDEINLPAKDKYDTQLVLQFLRQLICHNGYYRAKDKTWVQVENRVQVVGACNPPTDAGRNEIPHRLLRFIPVLFVDFPSREALHVIYKTYITELFASFQFKFMTEQSQLRIDALTKAMVDVYSETQTHFTPNQQPHYLYSPRELTRWTRALRMALRTWTDESTTFYNTNSNIEEDVKEQEVEKDTSMVGAHKQINSMTSNKQITKLVRLAVHEGLRVFADRLVHASEKKWMEKLINLKFINAFTHISRSVIESRPLLYTSMLTQRYQEVNREELRSFLNDKLHTFANEEEVGTLPLTNQTVVNGKSSQMTSTLGTNTETLVLFDDMIDHIVRADRVLKQPLGHLLMAGASGVGKTMIARFVSWLNGFAPFWLKIHRRYTLQNFEEDLRFLLRRTGVHKERVCFLFDESNIVEQSFLEYMNALLASGEVPGLFDGDEWEKLMYEIKEAIRRENERVNTNTSLNNNSTMILVDVNNSRALYDWFVNNVKTYLHVIFTINPHAQTMSSRTTTSPALFNRCTLDWFGDWSAKSLYAIAYAQIGSVEEFKPVIPNTADNAHLQENSTTNKNNNDNNNNNLERGNIKSQRVIIAESLSHIHCLTMQLNKELINSQFTQPTSKQEYHDEAIEVNKNNAMHHLPVRNEITPRHFMECVSQFRMLYVEKRALLLSQHRHLRDGLQKLNNAAEEVQREQAELHKDELEVTEKTHLAEQMLETILEQTNSTQHEKQSAEQLRQQLEQDQHEIVEESATVEHKLKEVQPMLEAASAALNTVKPEYLLEIRSYTTPPLMVRRVLTAVVSLMANSINSNSVNSNTTTITTANTASPSSALATNTNTNTIEGFDRRVIDWEAVKMYIRRDDFLNLVKAFKPSDITDLAREKVKELTSNSSLSIEAAQRASKAAGPLLQWLYAQVNYANVYSSVKPMRERIAQLQEERITKETALEMTLATITSKEETLHELKVRYQASNEEVVELKRKINVIRAKCTRARTILSQLATEHIRWESELNSVMMEFDMLHGHCLLGGAFIAYIGFYDSHIRHTILLPAWHQCLQSHRIATDVNWSAVSFLTTPREQLTWEAAGLPRDEFALENASIMKRSLRYAFLIDPNAIATRFLVNCLTFNSPVNASSIQTQEEQQQQHQQQQQQLRSIELKQQNILTSSSSSASSLAKELSYTQGTINTIHITSFHKSDYLKQIEMAARFGYALLMHDAEHVDEALQPLLNKEFRRHGGRFITRVGATEIDIALLSFKLYLSTRTLHFQPSQSVMSEVCLINFTTTHSSLESQALHELLLHEWPETDQERTRLIIAQGEFAFRVRELEQHMLSTLANSEGSLLDNNVLIDSLNSLKGQIQNVQSELQKSQEAMQMLHTTEELYKPMATLVAQTYFALNKFSQLNFLYEFDVDFVIRVLKDAFTLLDGNNNDNNNINEEEIVSRNTQSYRLRALCYYYFRLLYTRVLRAMFSDDHTVAALRIAQLRGSICFEKSNNSQDNKCIYDHEWEMLILLLSQTKILEEKEEEESFPDSSNNRNNDKPRSETSNDTLKEVRDILDSIFDKVMLEEHALEPMIKEIKKHLLYLLSHPLFTQIRSDFVQVLQGISSDRWIALISNSPSSSSSSSDSFAFSFTQLQCISDGNNNHVIDDGDDAGKALLESINLRQKFMLLFVIYYAHRANFIAAANELIRDYLDSDNKMVEEYVHKHKSNISSSNEQEVKQDNKQKETNEQKDEEEHLKEHISNESSVSPTLSHITSTMTNLREIIVIHNELTSTIPLLCITNTNADPAVEIDQSRRECGVEHPLYTVAMGSKESVFSAQRALQSAMQYGGWVLLKNIHYDVHFLDDIEKRMYSAKHDVSNRVHDSFRLFLTAEWNAQPHAHNLTSATVHSCKSKCNILSNRTQNITQRNSTSNGINNTKLAPVNLLAMCIIVVMEPATGMKASLMQTYGKYCSTISSKMSNTETTANKFNLLLVDSSEKLTRVESESPNKNELLQRLYFTASWLHAIIVERLNYVPVGWTEVYEFGEMEFTRVINAIGAFSNWCSEPLENKVKQVKTLQKPTLNINWNALHVIITETIYGGKISSSYDAKILDSISTNYLQSAVLLAHFNSETNQQQRDKQQGDQHDDKVNTKQITQESKGAFILAEEPCKVALPSSVHTEEQILSWMATLPDGPTPPQWLRLPSFVSDLLKAGKAQETLMRFERIQETYTSHKTSKGISGSNNLQSNEENTHHLQNEWIYDEISDYCNDETGVHAFIEEHQNEEQYVIKNASKVGEWSIQLSAALETLQQVQEYYYKNNTVVRSSALHNLLQGLNWNLSELESVNKNNNNMTTSGLASNVETTLMSSAPLLVALQYEVYRVHNEIQQVLENLQTQREFIKREKCANMIGSLDKWEQTERYVQYLIDASHHLHEICIALIQEENSYSEEPIEIKQERVHDHKQIFVNMSLLSEPQRILSATKQEYARRYHVPLERLIPHVTLITTYDKDKEQSVKGERWGVNLEGILLHFARVNESTGLCELIDECAETKESNDRNNDISNNYIKCYTTPLRVRWSWMDVHAEARCIKSTTCVNNDDKDHENTQNKSESIECSYRELEEKTEQQKTTVLLPLYSNEDRTQIIEQVELPVSSNINVEYWYEYGVCLTIQN